MHPVGTTAEKKNTNYKTARETLSFPCGYLLFVNLNSTVPSYAVNSRLFSNQTSLMFVFLDILCIGFVSQIKDLDSSAEFKLTKYNFLFRSLIVCYFANFKTSTNMSTRTANIRYILHRDNGLLRGLLSAFLNIGEATSVNIVITRSVANLSLLAV